MFVSYSNFGRSALNLLSSTNLTLNPKIFQGILSHLHGNHKQDIEDKCDPNICKAVF